MRKKMWKRSATRSSGWVLGWGLAGWVVFASWALAGWVSVSAVGAAQGVAGYGMSATSSAVRFAFNVPGALPVSGNIVEDDLPFAQTTVSFGPVVNAIGAPWYPGSVAAHAGTDLNTFGFPVPIPNDPLLADAQYPPSPAHSAAASFGVAPSLPLGSSPHVLAARSDAGAQGSSTTSWLGSLAVGPEGGAPASPLVEVTSMTSANSTAVGSGSVAASASTQVGEVKIAGIVAVAGLSSEASVSSNGQSAHPLSKLYIGKITVAGVPAYVNATGVHVAGTGPFAGPAVSLASSELQNTFAQDGISVRLVNPTTTESGGSATVDTGGMVVTIQRRIEVPYVPGEPSVPVPNFGALAPPSGTYLLKTTITLGESNVAVSATHSRPCTSCNQGPQPTFPPSTGAGQPGTPGVPAVPSSPGIPASYQTLSPSGPGAGGPAGAGAPMNVALAARSERHLPSGMPIPIGWVVGGVLVSIALSGPLLQAVRWQFLLGRGR